MEYRTNYRCKIPLSLLTDFALNANLLQVVNFNTWSRIIKGQKKESVLYHIYVSKHELIDRVTFSTPTFGDHLLIMIELNLFGHAKN